MIVNMNDLKKVVSEPEKTIVFSHIPRKFSNVDTCVDMAEFGIVQKSFKINGQAYDEGNILQRQFAYSLVQQGLPIQMKKENRGNESLKSIYEELGIKKSVTGHFHESAGRAHDAQGVPVEEGLFVHELFYNASCMDRLMLGMLTVDDAKVAYENIDLKKYIKRTG